MRSKRYNRRDIHIVPLRKLFPSIITMLALCLGVTAMKFGFQNKFTMATSFIIFATILDMLDGKMARMLNATSVFGAQLDSIVDMVNFGIAPIMILYSWAEQVLNIPNNQYYLWSISLLYASCAAMRLAKFNAQTINPGSDLLSQGYFFRGVPSTISSILVMLPMIITFDLKPNMQLRLGYLMAYIGIIAALMVCPVPTFSVKRIKINKRLAPIFLLLSVLLILSIISEPWVIIPFLGMVYFATIPLVFLYYRSLTRKKITSMT